MAVHPRMQEGLDRPVGGGNGPGKGDRRPAREPDRGGAVRRKLGDEALALADRVLDEARDHAPYELVDAARWLEARIAPVDLGEEIAQERDFGEVVDREQPGAQPVV